MLDLGKVQLFRELEPPELAAILAAARQIEVARAHYLFFEQEQATALYLLLSGWVRLLKLATDGRQSLARFVGPYEVAGISAIMADGVYRLTAQAASPCVILAWEGGALARILDRHPRMRENALGLLSSYLDDLQQQYLELATEHVDQRIAHTLARIAERYGSPCERGMRIAVPLSQHDLADLVGVTHYTVSRILSGWRDQNIVAIGRAQITILDLRRLLVSANLPAPDGDR